MKDFIKRLRADYLFSSLMCIALGIVFIAWPDKVNEAVGTVIAVVLIVVGIVYLASFFLKFITNGMSAAIGAIVLLIGVWILIQPAIVGTLIPIVVGVIMLGHGIRGLRESAAAKNFGFSNWGIGIVFSIISLALGIVCICNAFGVISLIYVVIGIALVFNGLSNIWISVTTSSSERKYRKEQETIDVEFKEDKDETDGV